MTELHLIQLLNYPILQQLQLEEALLRSDKRNWCIVNQGSPPAIVMGISGKTELLVNSKRMAENPVPLIRRFSGGGTVFVDEYTCFVTFICNSEQINIPCCPERVLQWSAAIYKETLPDIDFHLRENDYAIGNRKFGGNAQYFCKGRWLHHSSLLWDYDPKNMEYLLFPPKTPKYRQQRNHNEFLVRLKDAYPCKNAFRRSILNTLHRSYSIVETDLSEVDHLLNHSHRKATTLIDNF